MYSKCLQQNPNFSAAAYAQASCFSQLEEIDDSEIVKAFKLALNIDTSITPARVNQSDDRETNSTHRVVQRNPNLLEKEAFEGLELKIKHNSSVEVLACQNAIPDGEDGAEDEVAQESVPQIVKKPKPKKKKP
jgi:hypothetical protein